MNHKEKAYIYLAGIVGLGLTAMNPDPKAGSAFGWALYGAMMTGLVYGLVRTLSHLPDHGKRTFERNSRSHHEVR